MRRNANAPGEEVEEEQQKRRRYMSNGEKEMHNGERERERKIPTDRRAFSIEKVRDSDARGFCSFLRERETDRKSNACGFLLSPKRISLCYIREIDSWAIRQLRYF